MRGRSEWISQKAIRMQSEVAEANREVFSKGDIEIDDARKTCIAAVDSVMKNSEFLSEKDVDEFVSSVEELSSELKKKVSSQKSQTTGGNVHRTEWGGHDGSKLKKSRRKHMSVDYVAK